MSVVKDESHRIRHISHMYVLGLVKHFAKVGTGFFEEIFKTVSETLVLAIRLDCTFTHARDEFLIDEL